jgi:hypothetical protein
LKGRKNDWPEKRNGLNKEILMVLEEEITGSKEEQEEMIAGKFVQKRG